MVIPALLSKIAVPALIFVAGAVGGIGLQQKVFNSKRIEIPKCPDCRCPEPTVSVQPFDVDKIKNLKSFTYSPDFKGQISVAGVDSSSIRKYIDEAVMRAFEKHMMPEKKKRRW